MAPVHGSRGRYGGYRFAVDPRRLLPMTVDLSFIDQPEHAIQKGALARRGELLARVTDLFVLGAERFDEEDIARFDDVIMRLAVDIELSARALLAVRLAPIPNAPPTVIRTLAFDDDIGVAGPVLRESERLDDRTLVENARRKSQEHLFAISRRRSLSEPVTDVLVVRGERRVVLSTVGNPGARFSAAGFETIIGRSAGDDALAGSLGRRPDIPPQLFIRLLTIASETVRAKLEAVHPTAILEVHRAVGEVTERIRKEALDEPRDYSAAKATVDRLLQSGGLNDGAVAGFAKAGRFEETTVALARMCELPVPFVERALVQDGSETVLILAKVIGLSWATVKEILSLRVGKRTIPAHKLAESLAHFERLKPATANEIVRFYRARGQTARNASGAVNPN
jgi:uncharacterized protein (DUF2336 family)